MDTVQFMQSKIKEAHLVMKKVKEYLDNNTLKNHEGVSLDYSDPDQEFYIRLFTEFDQLASMLDIFMGYIEKPVRVEGELQFDYSSGVYKLGDEEIVPGEPIEFMIDSWWKIGLLQKDPSNPMSYHITDIREKRHDTELKGLKVRLR